DYNPNTNQWSEVQKYKVNYTGTNFDDEISFDNTTSFKSEVGSSFTSSDATTYTFNGGSGDDSFIGSSASGVKSVAVYSGAKAAYDIAEIGDTNVFTVTHKIPDALGGTGVDTLTNIDAIKFGYQTSSEEIVRLNVETGSTGGSARYFRGTMFNDDIDNASGDFAGLLSGNDVLGKSGGGVDNFYAGGGTDTLQMGGFYSRYTIKYDATDGHLEIVDTLTTNLGGDGTVNIKDVESIQFYNNVFELRIAGGDGSDATNYSLYMDHTTLGTVKIADGATIDGSGNILTAGGLNIFAVSQTPSEHAPTYSWEQMLGASVGTLAAPLDMNVHVKPYLDGTTASLAPNQFGSTVATQTAGISVDVNQTSVTDFSSFDGSGSSADITATKNVYEGFFQGFGNDDVMYGGAGNDTFVGGPGDDVFNGRGENQTDWWDSFNSGDTVQYIGVEARYTISGPTTDVDADNNGFTDTRGFKVDTAGDTLSYFTVTDSLPLAQGGDGTDYLINIEKIRFQDGDYHLSIRDVGNSWDTWTQLFGTSGNDDFTSYTDDSADPAAKEYNINGGAGDDLIIGGAEPSGDTYSWGDSAVYEAQEQNFDISIEELTFVADSASATDDWDGDGDVDADDTTLSGVLKTKFGGTAINKVTVQDSRADEAGGLGTDTLYGIEHIEYRSGHSGSHVDLAPRSDDWDGDGVIDYFSGTAYGDVFTSDEGRQDVQGRAGDDIIITGASGDYINPGEGNDYVNSGVGETVDANDSWASRDDVNFHSVSYARVEVEKVTLWTNDTTGRALETADGKWSLSGYRIVTGASINKVFIC
ncbi:hypothetical protein OAI87_01620, partial [Paracoccaceae bacterium]|nr:hypothetical protein [Paracoccaceae bacterium]